MPPFKPSVEKIKSFDRFYRNIIQNDEEIRDRIFISRRYKLWRDAMQSIKLHGECTSSSANKSEYATPWTPSSETTELSFRLACITSTDMSPQDLVIQEYKISPDDFFFLRLDYRLARRIDDPLLQNEPITVQTIEPIGFMGTRSYTETADYPDIYTIYNTYVRKAELRDEETLTTFEDTVQCIIEGL
jgi:hypothetical protein